MFEIGEIKKGREIGYLDGRSSHKFVRQACVICGKERWVALRKGILTSLQCRIMQGLRHKTEYHIWRSELVSKVREYHT